MRIAKLIFLFAVAASLTSFVFAQTGTSSLRGTVTDPKGAVISGATATLSNPQTGYTRTATTDRTGVYQFLEVPPATYLLKIEATGFATEQRSNLTLMVNTPATLDVEMQVSGQAVTVEVTGAAPLVNTQDATLGHAFNTDQIQNLPFEGRDPTGILSLQAGVAYTGNNQQAMPNSQDSRSGSVAGARSDQANIVIDGVDNNDPVLGQAFQGALRPTLDSLQEFRVTTTGGNADEGRSSGAQVVMVTKSGTNQFHGTLYEYHRPTFTTANDWFVKNAQLGSGQPNIPGKLIRNTFGGSLGGPIKKDRLFFFATYEGQRLRENTSVVRTVPSADLRNGFISYISDTGSVVRLSPAQIASMDPNCSTSLGPGVPGGTCPLGPGANPAVMQIFKQYPMPNTDIVGDGFNFRGYQFTAGAPAKRDTYIVKLDYNLTPNGNHRLFLRGNLQNDSVAGLGTDGPEFPGDPSNLTYLNNSKGIAAGYTAILRNNLINSFRYGFIREGFDNVGLQNSPFVNFRGLNDLNGQTSTSRVIVPMQNFVDDVTWTKGKHTFQFGGNLRIINDERVGNTDSYNFGQTNVSWLDAAGIAGSGESLDPGAFGFAPVSGDFSQSYDLPMAALAGLVPFVEGEYNRDKTGALLPQGAFIPRHFKSHEAEWYAQDTLRVTPTLTVTFGARYTLLQPPYEVHGNQVAPTVDLSTFFNQRGQLAQQGLPYNVCGPYGTNCTNLVGLGLSGQGNGKSPFWNWDYGNIAPRVSFAWAPEGDSGIWKRITGGGAGKFSIRGGWGIYYDHFGEGIVNSFDRNGSFGLTTLIDNPAATQSVDSSPRFSQPTVNFIPTTAAQGCGAPPCNIQPPAPTGPFPTVPPTDLSGGGFAITWGLDGHMHTPYSHVVNFSITRELPKNFVVEASYVGRFAHHLLQEADLATPVNMRDPKSGMDYFTAATLLAKAANAGVPIQQIGNIPFWQNFFPSAAGPAATQLGFGSGPGNGCAPGDGSVTGNVTATQAVYDMYSCFTGNETTALYSIDVPGGFGINGPGGCFPACATINGKQTNGYVFYNPQWSSLYAWRSMGNSAYNGLQLSLRKRMSNGLNLDFNYTYSKSIDMGSNAERINEFEGFGVGASQIINAWNPKQLRAVSDFDNTHQINANWVYELPVGRGKHFGGGMGSVLNAFLGGWSIAGLWRWSSGFPFTIEPGLGFWGTDWQLTSAAVQTGPLPKTGSYMVAATSGGSVLPNVFQDPSAAIQDFRLAYPGESGQRNNLRGPGTFDIDASLGKTWNITEDKQLSFRWETFNVTNTPRFDVGQMQYNGNNSLATSAVFGTFTNTLNLPRLMEFALRFSF
ncbi:MAG: carboxypeptidase regulatory-like domain-containing protein [Chlamydiota bacterium]